jgi:hypothetical protein
MDADLLTAPRMGPKTRTAEANEFCLVLTASRGAPLRAREAIHERFRVLADEHRRNLAAAVAELVQSSVDRDPRKARRPITIAVAVGDDAIHGEVSDQGGLVPFEIPIAG